jgi:hypothetical protein
MTVPSAKIAAKANRTTETTASPRGKRRCCSIRTCGASIKLRMPASVTGSKTSRARNKLATTITKISRVSRGLSNDEYEFMYHTPLNSGFGCKRDTAFPQKYGGGVAVEIVLEFAPAPRKSIEHGALSLCLPTRAPASPLLQCRLPAFL